MGRTFEAKILSEDDVTRIIEAGRKVIGEVGVVVENDALLDILAAHGAEVSRAEMRARFSGKVIDALLEGSSDQYDALDGLEVSCLLPYGERANYSHGVECTAGTYPTAYLDVEGAVKTHTVESVADMTRLADAMEHIDRLGSMGVPSDVPAQLTPLYQRLLAWKHAERKLSGCGEVRDEDLFDAALEMGRIAAADKKSSLRRFMYGEVELISPLKFARHEASIFVKFWKQDLYCGIGFMHSAGGSAPATLAGLMALNVAENLFINFLYRHCYGFKKLWFQSNSSVLDMRRGMFPFGRPERGLLTVATGQVARRLRAGLWASAIYPDAKVPSCEAGMQAAFNVTPAVMAGSLGLECFGLLSGAEMNSPVQLVIDNEFAGAVKRFARGFQVDDTHLALDAIREVGPGGNFLEHEQTLEFFRCEHWQPSIFSREALGSWLESGKKVDTMLARERCETILREHRPQGISRAAEKELLKVIQTAGRRYS